MAGGTTRVTAEALATAIQNFEARKQEFQVSYLKISNIVRELSTNYKSEAATALYSKFDDIYKNLSAVENRMEGATNKLKQVREVYEALAAMQQALIDAMEKNATAVPNIFG